MPDLQGLQRFLFVRMLVRYVSLIRDEPGMSSEDHTHQERGLGLSTRRKTFQVMVEPCSCHEEILVDVA